MSVKLLPKSAIAEQKAKAQRREIEEGMKVATRVDGLRQTYAKAEQELEAWRAATLASIGEEIRKLDEKKERLSADINVMQSKCDRMMSEISTKRRELAQFEKSLRTWEKNIGDREEKVLLDELEIAEAKSKAELYLSAQKDNERITANLLVEANKKKNEAQDTLETARKVQEKAYSDKKDIEAEMSLREFSIKTKEQEILKKEMQLDEREKELNIEKIKVNDMRQTLNRSLERIRKGRLA